MRAGHDGNQRGACLKRVGGHRCGGEWATVGLHHGGVAPPLQQSAERVHLTRSGVTQSMDTPPSSFRFCPGWPAHCAWQQGGEFSGAESLEKRRGEGRALSLARGLRVSFRMYPPPPLSRAPSADSLLPRSLPLHSPSPLNPSLISPYSNLPMPLAVGVCFRGVIGAERDSVWGGLLTGKRGR